MGNTLSEPVTAKETTTCGDSRYRVAASSMQGWRINMEDAHVNLLSLPEDKEAAIFAVYDGHGGAKVAKYASKNLHTIIPKLPSYLDGNISSALKQAFLTLDADMCQDEEMKDELAGSTAVLSLIKDGKIYCANVGDSRAVASVSGDVEELSFDHKPNNDEEIKRIIDAGGWVEYNRVNGNLALSRAFGDFVFKKNETKGPEEQIVTALPDVTFQDLTNDHEFMVIACDGIWDVLTNEEVVDFVRERFADALPPEEVCEQLLSRCLAPDCHMGGLGCDNMTAVIVCFLQDENWEHFSKRCALPKRSSILDHLDIDSTNISENSNSDSNTNYPGVEGGEDGDGEGEEE